MRDSHEPTDELVRQRFVRVVGLPADPDEPDHVDAAGDPDGREGPTFDGRAGSSPALAALSPGRRGVRALAAVAAVAVVLAAFLAWRARPRVEAVRATPEPAPSSSTVAGAGYVVVAVAGRVRRPGLVRLPAGARVADAIDAAGGALPGTDLAFVNLARKLVDGELLVIGVTPPPGALAGPAGPGGAPAGPVNLNTATLEQLETLPGIGPVLAQHILDYRARHDGFHSVSELRQVDGVGDSRYAQLKDLVTV